MANDDTDHQPHPVGTSEARANLNRRTAVRLAATLLALAIPVAALAGDGDDPAASKTASTPLPKTDAEREAVALAFVREHHPELAALLAQLKPMRPGEYAKAVRELAQVSRSLNELKARDPRRYDLGLDAWKTRSHVELLTARLASDPSPSPRPELESQLRQAVEAQLDAQARQQRFERDQAEARLARLNENLKRLETDHDALVATRLQALLKKGRRTPVNRPGAGAVATGKARPKAPASGSPVPGSPAAVKNTTRPNENETSTKGERLP